MEIKIDVVGKIISGDDKGRFVKIQNDSQNTGGFLVLISTKQDFSEKGYDDWVESYDSLQKYFNESSWNVNWLL